MFHLKQLRMIYSSCYSSMLSTIADDILIFFNVLTNCRCQAAARVLWGECGRCSLTYTHTLTQTQTQTHAHLVRRQTQKHANTHSHNAEENCNACDVCTRPRRHAPSGDGDGPPGDGDGPPGDGNTSTTTRTVLPPPPPQPPSVRPEELLTLLRAVAAVERAGPDADDREQGKSQYKRRGRGGKGGRARKRGCLGQLQQGLQCIAT